MQNKCMGDVYLIPVWFLGFDAAMSLLFSVVTFAIALVAHHVYRISAERNIRHLSAGFLLIGLSYALWALNHLVLVGNITGEVIAFSLEGLPTWWSVTFYLHMALFVGGLATITYATLKVRRGDIYYLLLGLSLLVIASSFKTFATFRIVSMFLLSFIAYHSYKEYLFFRNRKTLAVCGAFVLLFVSSIMLIFAASYSDAYVIAQLFELGAYSLLLIILLRNILKYGNKKKKPA